MIGELYIPSVLLFFFQYFIFLLGCYGLRPIKFSLGLDSLTF